MSERPIHWVNAITGIVNAIVNVEVGVISIEDNSNRFILLSRNEIEMTILGKLIYFEDAPN